MFARFRRRQVIALLILTLTLMAGCARPASPAGSEQAPPAQGTAPMPAQPSAPQPADAVAAPLAYTLQINGKEAAPGSTVEADFAEAVAILLRFPVPVAKESLEPVRKRLPDGAVLTFPDERTARFLVQLRGSFAIDPTGARSQDGKAEVREAAPVQVSREPYARASLYRVEELLAGKKEPAARWRLPYRPIDGFVLSPDRTQALLFKSDPMVPGPAPSLLDLKSGANRPLGLAAGEYSSGGWLPDGRLFLLGGSLWLSTDGGNEWKAAVTGLWGWLSKLSPQGRQIALWAPPGKVTVVEMATGAKRELTEPFRRPVQDGASIIDWSPDGQWLAGSDFDNDTNAGGARIRIVDPTGRRPGRTIEGVGLIAWLPDGKLLGWQRNHEGKEPWAVHLFLVDPASGEKRLILEHWASPSPDGRYLAYTATEEQSQVSYLLEIATGKRVRVPLLGRWTGQGELLVLEGP